MDKLKMQTRQLSNVTVAYGKWTEHWLDIYVQ